MYSTCCISYKGSLSLYCIPTNPHKKKRKHRRQSVSLHLHHHHLLRHCIKWLCAHVLLFCKVRTINLLAEKRFTVCPSGAMLVLSVFPRECENFLTAQVGGNNTPLESLAAVGGQLVLMFNLHTSGAWSTHGEFIVGIPHHEVGILSGGNRTL